MNDSIKFDSFQARENIKNGAAVVLASARVAVEAIKESGTAKKVCAGILAALVLILTALVSFRVAEAREAAKYEAWKERFVNDYISQREAEERGMPIDPREELKKQEITAIAQFIQGVKRFNYSFGDFVTAAWGMDARTRNPSYPDTLIEVIQQPKQWLGYSSDTEVTKENYATAEKVWNTVHGADHPEVSSDFVYASFEAEGITLRDTWEISTRTHFWRWEG